MVIMPSFTSKAAAKLVGISFRQLDYLDRTVSISPTGTLMHKKRSPRVYSYTDLIGLATANRLLSLGIKIADLENALSSLQEQINKIHPPYNDYFFVTDLNNQHRLVRSEDEIIETFSDAEGFDQLLIIDLDDIIKKVDRSIEKLKEEASKTA